MHDKFELCLKDITKQSIEFSNNFSKFLERSTESVNLNLKYLNYALIKERIIYQCNSFMNSKVNNLQKEMEDAAVNLKKDYSDTIGKWRKFKDMFIGDSKINNRIGKEAFEKFQFEKINPTSKKLHKIGEEFNYNMQHSIQTIIKEIQSQYNQLLDNKQQEIISIKENQGVKLESMKSAENVKLSYLIKNEGELKDIMKTIISIQSSIIKTKL